MGEEAPRLFTLAIDAYVEGDAGLAAALDDIDDTLDELHNDYIQAIFESPRRRRLDLQAAVQLALIGRYYERIGDHAVNIGERVAVHGHRLAARAQRSGPRRGARPPCRPARSARPTARLLEPEADR